MSRTRLDQKTTVNDKMHSGIILRALRFSISFVGTWHYCYIGIYAETNAEV